MGPVSSYTGSLVLTQRPEYHVYTRISLNHVHSGALVKICITEGRVEGSINPTARYTHFQ
jgi:hypothetical protein